MKKIIAGLLCAATVSGAIFAQEATLYNKLGTTAVRKGAYTDSKPYMADIYDEIRATYESDKFSTWGQVKLTIAPEGERFSKLNEDNGPWKQGAKVDGDVEFNAAFRPVEFLEIIGGTNYGEEGLWSASYVPGLYGYGTDFSYGVREWAAGPGATVAFRGAGVGVDGLTIGWNVLKAGKLKVGDKLTWNTAFAASYAIPELVSVGAAAQIDTTEKATQKFGFGAEVTAIENMKIGLGINMATEATSYYFDTDANEILKQVQGMGQEQNSAANYGWEEGVVAALNAGVEYNFAGMGLPLLVGADAGLVLGKKEIGEVNVMPMTFGGFVSFGLLENLLVLDARITFESNMADADAAKVNVLKVIPRVWFNATEADELRLEVPITNQKVLEKSHTGFDVGLYWKHTFKM